MPSHPDLETYVGPPVEEAVRTRRTIWRHVERWLLGVGMAVIAWFLERAVKRAEKKKAKSS